MSGVHSARTRPEAEAIARKMRGESDWFGHDSTVDAAVPHKHTNDSADKNAQKMKGESDRWFEHSPEQSPTEPPPAQVPETQPEPQAAPAPQAEPAPAAPEPTPAAPEPAPEPAAAGVAVENGKKMKGGSGAPAWYGHEGHGETPGAGESLETPRGRPTPRFTAAEAGDYLERNKQGSVSDWYTHDHGKEPSQQQMMSPRVTSSEGQAIASRLKGESENWYNYDSTKKNPPAKAQEKYRSPQAQDMVDKSRGGGMGACMNMGQNDKKPAKAKPAAADVAEKNKQGLMDKYQQATNNNTPRGAAGLSRPKAEAANNAQKQAGGSMNKLMSGEIPSPTKGSGRAVKPEAEYYANRNQGTLKGLMDTYGQMGVSERPPPKKTQSAEAAAIAEKHKGSVAGCFSYGNY